MKTPTQEAPATEHGLDSPGSPVTGITAPRRWRQPLAIVVIVGLTVLLGIVFGSRFGKDPRLVESPLIGEPLPNAELPYLEQDGTLRLSDLRGEVVVLNFWASWCVGCRLEHDDLLIASAKYRDQGVQFIGVNYQDERADAIAFLDELGRGYPSVIDVDSRLGVELGVYGIPETFFVDRDGILRAKISGESHVGALSAILDDILAGHTPRSIDTGKLQAPPAP